MSGLRVLITGASVAGPALGLVLARSGAIVTLVERSKALRTEGQNIDIRGVGIGVIKRLGVEKAIRQHTTTEAGLVFVNSQNEVEAEFPAQENDSNSPTAEIEILRGQLAQILYDASKDKVEYIFDNRVTSIEQNDDVAHVSFANGTPKDYDLVVAADGQTSKTRAIAFGEKADGCVHSLGQYMAYFSIPRGDTDTEMARWYNAPERRCILLRPDNTGSTRAVLGIVSSDPALDGVLESGVEEQRKLMRRLFDDAGWETERILNGMDTTDDFYMQQVAQVKLPEWSVSRFCVVGDSAYCPSPISGMGTTCALVGAYVLAGEICKHGKDYRSAFREYDRIMRPFVERAQKLPPGGPKLLNPETSWGISLLNTTLGVFTQSGLAKLFEKFAGSSADSMELPNYPI
ncbi:MAG: hypothetical protein M1820_007335 [Bogoriella megaspora]|nr:MAG: hypothetical protein M1820_007335 [Bogoriella megaspora]